MENSELTDIESSVQALVRRAYEAGRSDVLKRVVDVLKTDQPLALTGPHRNGVDRRTELVPTAVNNEQRQRPVGPVGPKDRPWWAWPVR